MKLYLNIRQLCAKMCSTVFFALLLNLVVYGQSQIPLKDWWVPDGSVLTMVADSTNHILYVGGDFKGIYLNTPNGTAVNTSTGIPDLNYVRPNNYVSAVIPDGSGGWFIGGNFTMIGKTVRNHLAHINSSGQLAPWNPDVNDYVNALVLSGNTLYIGGGFSSVGGQSRNYLAAVDITTGQPIAFSPNLNQSVQSLVIAGNAIYAGGQFTSVDGQIRNRIAAFDINNGQLLAWDGNINGNIVNTLAANNGLLYVGGDFTTASGQSRVNLAAFDVTSGSLTAFNPGADYPVLSMLVNNNILYLGGYFSSVGGQPRSNLAAINVNTGTASSWNPGANAAIRTLSASGNIIYAGGDFTSINSQTRNCLAAIDGTTGVPTSWNPNVSLAGGVLAVSVDGGNIYVGGGFVGMNGVSRNRLAAFDESTGTPTSWNPNADDIVNILSIRGGTVYAGGSFNSIGGQPRFYVAAIDAVTGSPTSWNPILDNSVFALTTDATNVYVGGNFTSVSGTTRNRLASININTGVVTSWNPNVGSSVRTIVLNGNTMYIGGAFTSVGGVGRNRLASFDLNTGALSSWNPNASSIVLGILADNNSVYVAGFFTSVGGQPRPNVACINASTGIPTTWTPGIDGGIVRALAKFGSRLYIGGNFSVNGYFPGAVSLDLATGSLAGWQSGGANGNALLVSNGRLFHGGSFSYLPGGPRANLGVYEFCKKAPKVPGSITQSNGITKVCPGETRTYSIADVLNAYTYCWVVPTGATIVSGQGTTSIVVSFDNTLAAVDTIKVRAESDCGVSSYRTKGVIRGAAPNPPLAITGDNYGMCSSTAIAYSVTDIPGLTYAWSFSNSNGTVASGQGNSTITADFSPGAATTVLSVTAANGCGTSNPRNKTIYTKPAKPVSMTGSSAVCAHATGAAYSTPVINGATTYTWKAPLGSHVSDGVTTSTGTSLTTTSNSVTVNFGATSGDVQVRANNTCGSSAFLFKPITMNCRMAGEAEEIIASGDISVYPNPASDQVTVRFRADRAGEYTIHLYDVIGKEVLVTSGNAVEGTNEVDVNTAAFAAGVYHLVLKGAHLDYNTRLVLDK